MSRQPKCGYNEAKTLSTVHKDVGICRYILLLAVTFNPLPANVENMVNS